MLTARHHVLQTAPMPGKTNAERLASAEADARNAVLLVEKAGELVAELVARVDNLEAIARTLVQRLEERASGAGTAITADAHGMAQFLAEQAREANREARDMRLALLQEYRERPTESITELAKALVPLLVQKGKAK